jgi:isoquinoline 1-oxidoreductase beta subunit
MKVFGGTGALMVCLPMGSLFAQTEGRNSEDLFEGKLGPFVQINPDNTITIGAPIPDMGTGVSTSLPMIVANELDANWDGITIETLPPSLYLNEKGEPILNYVLQSSGGSWSVAKAWQPLRECGALARHLILRAAAQELSVSVKDLITKNSHVIVKFNGNKYPYSQFVETAKKLKIPGLGRKIYRGSNVVDRIVLPTEAEGGPSIKAKGEGDIIGREKGLKAAQDIVTGKMEFGIDKRIENQLYAQIERCPHYFGDVKSFDAQDALKIKGVVDVIQVPNLDKEGTSKFNSPGIAVIAESFWAAKKGRDALKIVWNKGPNTQENNAWHEQELRDAIPREATRTLDEKGDIYLALSTADKTFEGEYEVPFWAHFCMEPINCAVWVKKDEVVAKLSHQFPERVSKDFSQKLGIPFDKFTVDNGRIGGGYGRKGKIDFVSEAVFLSQKTGRAVKVHWTREDEIRHGFINSSALYRIKAGVDEQGKLIAWDALASRKGTAWLDGFPETIVPHSRLRRSYPNINAPTGAWRGPGHNTTGFVLESMMDEIAIGLGEDPLEFRLRTLGEDKDYPYSGWTAVPTENKVISSTRMKGVLRLAAQKAGWGRKLAKGHGQGIASCFTFGSYAAIVVDVYVDEKGKLSVNKVTGAADCGLVINPLGAKAQMEGGCMDGLSAVLYQDIQFDEGRITTGNFHDIPLVRIDESPKKFDFHFVDSDEVPSGLGEIALPPFIPALMNAIYDATGKRFRKLPLGKQLKA